MTEDKKICSHCDKEARWIYTPYNDENLLCDEHAEEFRELHGIGKPVPEGGLIPPILWPIAIHFRNIEFGITVREDPGLTDELRQKIADKIRDNLAAEIARLNINTDVKDDPCDECRRVNVFVKKDRPFVDLVEELHRGRRLYEIEGTEDEKDE